MRREGRLCRVALLTLTAGHPGGADPRAQGPLCTGGQVVDGARQILEQDEQHGSITVFTMKMKLVPSIDTFSVSMSGLRLSWKL